MKLIRTFYTRIIDDFKQKKLMPLKLLFFVHASSKWAHIETREKNVKLFVLNLELGQTIRICLYQSN